MKQKLVTDIDLSMPKPYLSIGEVAAKFQVTPDLLRKWEQQFPGVLKPIRTQGDTRLYDQRAVQQVATIYRALRHDGLSVEAARRKLSNKRTMDDEATRQDVLTRLQSIRAQLQGIVDELPVF